MLTIEKDSKAEEICIHGTPESLRELAKKLWVIAEKSETQGKHHERITTAKGSDPELSTQLQGKAGEYSVINTLAICGRDK